jgi:triphosphoribosyl-dephospho-CoA synthetase
MQSFLWICLMLTQRFAWRAMLTEVNLSPKPGLVDRINNGAHKDMALEDFHRSAEAIQAWLPRFIEYGAFSAQLSPEDVLKGLRPLGMACEADMFRATAGVNTPKAASFSGPAAAIGRLHQLQLTVTAETICSTAATFCRGLTERELRQNNQQLTAGQRLYQQLGLTGAREAEAGYPLVIQHALPHYRALLTQGRDPELALLDTLLLLMSINGDTNVASWRRRRSALATAAGHRPDAARGIRTLPISNTYTSSTNSALNATSVPEAAPIADRHLVLSSDFTSSSLSQLKILSGESHMSLAKIKYGSYWPHWS